MFTPSNRLSLAILVVEDEPLILQLLIGYLRSFGVASFGASGAVEAERVLRDHAEEIGGAVIDLRMPGVDGLETRRRLDRIKPGLRCCLMSGAGLSGSTPPEGFLGTLDKPFAQAQLRASVDMMLGRSMLEGRAG
jgi:DNA-binding NtrC family response regulator